MPGGFDDKKVMTRYFKYFLLTLLIACRAEDSEQAIYSTTDAMQFYDQWYHGIELAMKQRKENLGGTNYELMIDHLHLGNPRDAVLTELFKILAKNKFAIVIEDHYGDAPCIFSIVTILYSEDAKTWRKIKYRDGCSDSKWLETTEFKSMSLIETMDKFINDTGWSGITGHSTIISTFKEGRLRVHLFYLDRNGEQKLQAVLQPH